MALISAGSTYQPPSSWAGTGPPGGGPAAADVVGRVAEEVGWPHDEARKTKAMPSKTAIRRSVVIRVRVKLHLAGGLHGKARETCRCLPEVNPVPCFSLHWNLVA
jgi:hypothetical protein